MSKDEFRQLIALFEQTQNHLGQLAARSINTSLVVRNWLYGWYIVEFENAAAERSQIYGKSLLENLANALADSGIKGMSLTSLRKFRQFYTCYEPTPQIKQELAQIAQTDAMKKIRQTLSVESFPEVTTDINYLDSNLHIFSNIATQFNLSWSHYIELLTIDNESERRFYEIESQQNSWSIRELKRQIASSLYQRLALSRDKDEIHKLSEQGLVITNSTDIIKDPLVLEFLDIEEKATYSEEELETAIINKLEQFLLELGKGFLFEARQKRFTFDNDHFYVDLVFYNRLLRCYVLIDLKRDKLTHQDLGQMQMYVNHFDRHVKTDDEAPTIGIVLCHRKNDALVELTLPKDANIYASQYQLYLPSKELLEQKLKDWSIHGLNND